MPWPGLDWTQWTEMFSFDLSDLSWSIIYHLLKSGPTCPPLLCILSRSRLTSHDWCRQKAPLHLLPILYWLYSGAHRPPPTPGKLPGRLESYITSCLSPGPDLTRSRISENYYIVLDSRHFPTQYKWRRAGWRAFWYRSLFSRSVSLCSCEYSKVWIFCQYFDTFRQFDGVYWVYTVFPSANNRLQIEWKKWKKIWAFFSLSNEVFN